MAAAVAIYLQSRELKEQRRELREQRRELTLQREQLELQRQELSRNVKVQTRIADTANYQLYLDLQVRLLILMFEQDELPAVFGLSGANDKRQSWMQHVYITAWMRLFQSGLVLGVQSAETLESALQPILSAQLGLDWWREVEELWRSEAAHAPPGREADQRVLFVDLIDRVVQETEHRLRRFTQEDR
jgi:LAS superfamily LD-carboxypeptidase LdcB